MDLQLILLQKKTRFIPILPTNHPQTADSSAKLILQKNMKETQHDIFGFTKAWRGINDEKMIIKHPNISLAIQINIIPITTFSLTYTQKVHETCMQQNYCQM